MQHGCGFCVPPLASITRVKPADLPQQPRRERTLLVSSQLPSCPSCPLAASPSYVLFDICCLHHITGTLFSCSLDRSARSVPFLSLPLYPAGSGPSPEPPAAWEARSSWLGAGPAREGQMQIRWLPHEKKLFRMSLSFVGLECGTSCEGGTSRVGGEGGDWGWNCHSPFLSPSPPATPTPAEAPGGTW